MVFAQFGQHIEQCHVFGIVVEYTLVAQDVPIGSRRVTAQFANTLGNRIDHGIKLAGLFIEHQVIVAKVRTTHVPVKNFGPQVKGGYIRDDAVHRRTDIARRRSVEVGWRYQWRIARFHTRLSACLTAIFDLDFFMAWSLISRFVMAVVRYAITAMMRVASSRSMYAGQQM